VKARGSPSRRSLGERWEGRCERVSHNLLLFREMGTLANVLAANDKRALRITGGSEGKSVSADILVTLMDLEKALVAAV